MQPVSYTLGWSDMALFAIFENGHIAQKFANSFLKTFLFSENNRLKENLNKTKWGINFRPPKIGRIALGLWTKEKFVWGVSQIKEDILLCRRLSKSFQKIVFCPF